jgi:hypothetical protein
MRRRLGHAAALDDSQQYMPVAQADAAMRVSQSTYFIISVSL